MTAKLNTQKPTRGTCNAHTKSGAKCHAPVYVLSDGTALPTCYFHTKAGKCPEVDQKRREAATRGGKVTRYNTTLDVNQSAIKDASGVSKVLATTLEALGSGTLDPRQATAIATLANALIKSLELELEDTRLSELEARISGTGGAVTEEGASEWIDQSEEREAH